jgi:hypothetical protein
MVEPTMSLDARSLPGDDGRWLEQAEKLLAGLGFCLSEADPAHGVDVGHLLIAIRPQPTLAHFDPERIEYWATESGRGRQRVLDRETRPAPASVFAWGQIAIVDRLGVRNEFLSFGGSLRVESTADGTIYANFSSHAPILRWSGHSQAGDPMAGEVGAFLARLKVPIDFVPGTEALIAQAAPSTLYCAFVQYIRDRLTQAKTLREANRWLAEWCLRETQRLQAAVPDHWKGATELRRQLSAAEAIARE